MSETNPFVVGAKVGVMDARAFGEVREDEVVKVHKTGNFILAGEPGVQWRAAGSGAHGWDAKRTSDRGLAWSTPSRCYPWTVELEERRAKKADEISRKRRWMDALHALEEMRHKLPPASFLDQIEAALAQK